MGGGIVPSVGGAVILFGLVDLFSDIVVNRIMGGLPCT